MSGPWNIFYIMVKATMCMSNGTQCMTREAEAKCAYYPNLDKTICTPAKLKFYYYHHCSNLTTKDVIYKCTYDKDRHLFAYIYPRDYED